MSKKNKIKTYYLQKNFYVKIDISTIHVFLLNVLIFVPKNIIQLFLCFYQSFKIQTVLGCSDRQSDKEISVIEADSVFSDSKYMVYINC